jgi:ribosomal protein S18 acetylase RimI-like enzyme
VGLIFWTEKSGFRKEAIVELEQIAVDPSLQGQRIGTALIQQSLPAVAGKIAERGACLRHLLVNTRADNYAQQLYRRTMGAVPAAKISGMFPVEEVYMIAKDVDIDPTAAIFVPKITETA